MGRKLRVQASPVWRGRWIMGGAAIMEGFQLDLRQKREKSERLRIFGNTGGGGSRVIVCDLVPRGNHQPCRISASLC